VQGFPKKKRAIVTKEEEQAEEDGGQEPLDAHQREGQLQLPMDSDEEVLVELQRKRGGLQLEDLRGVARVM
ncbi:hypothetical protein L7F22_012091, partial [Adiantum nelumboides]|nr:hypothetical protein [Adiantum nelumboides]